MPGGDGKEVVEQIRAEVPLIQQLVSKQERGYGIPGIPLLHVVVRKSDYEKRYFIPRLRIP